MTPEDFSKFAGNVAVWAQTEVEANGELILGMAHMAFRHTMLSRAKGVDAANSNQLGVIRSLFRMYPEKNRGVMTGMASFQPRDSIPGEM